jgi:hypothetical protein
VAEAPSTLDVFRRAHDIDHRDRLHRRTHGELGAERPAGVGAPWLQALARVARRPDAAVTVRRDF